VADCNERIVGIPETGPKTLYLHSRTEWFWRRLERSTLPLKNQSVALLSAKRFWKERPHSP